jgi:hypothetical protein
VMVQQIPAAWPPGGKPIAPRQSRLSTNRSGGNSALHFALRPVARFGGVGGLTVSTLPVLDRRRRAAALQRVRTLPDSSPTPAMAHFAAFPESYKGKPALQARATRDEQGTTPSGRRSRLPLRSSTPTSVMGFATAPGGISSSHPRASVQRVALWRRFDDDATPGKAYFVVHMQCTP